MGLLNKIKFKKNDNSLFEVDPNGIVKSKQIVTIGGILVAFVFIAVYVAYADKENVVPVSPSSNSTSFGQSSVSKNFTTVDSQINDRDIWMSTGVKRIEALARQQEELKQAIKKAAEKPITTEAVVAKDPEIAELKRQLEELKAELKKKVEQPAPNGLSNEARTEVLPLNPSSGAREPIIVKNRFFNRNDFDIGSVPEKKYEPVNREPVTPVKTLKSIVLSKVNMPSHDVINTESDNQSQSTAQSKSEHHYVDDFTPAGSSFRVVILGGLDAPTGGHAQDNPYPVLMMVDSSAVLPNRFSFNVKECRLLGSSYGDLSSERAVIRLEMLSCIASDGQVFERKVKGHVFGEDGKVGVRGRVISKQGQVLARALVAGIGSGIGSAFQQQASSYSTSALGQVASIDPDKVGIAGLGKGVSNAMDRLSQYYISLADKLFPVIEVDAGRVGDAVLTAGIDWAKEDSNSSIPRAIANNVSQTVDQAMGMVNDQQNSGQNNLNQ